MFSELQGTPEFVWYDDSLVSSNPVYDPFENPFVSMMATLLPFRRIHAVSRPLLPLISPFVMIESLCMPPSFTPVYCPVLKKLELSPTEPPDYR